MRRMIAGLLLVGVGLLLATDGVAATTRSARPKRGRAAPAARRLEPRLEPRALEILHAMSWRLANARTLAFHSRRHLRESEPPRSRAGLHHHVAGVRAAARQARGHHRGRRPGERVLLRRQDDDGLRPAENLVAVAEAPPTIDAALKAAYDSRGHLLPLHRRRRRRSLRRHHPGPDARLRRSGSRTWWAARRPTWWRSPTTRSSPSSGSAPRTSCRAGFARSISTIRRRLWHQVDLSRLEARRPIPASAFASDAGRRRAAHPVRAAGPPDSQRGRRRAGPEEAMRRRRKHHDANAHLGLGGMLRAALAGPAGAWMHAGRWGPPRAAAARGAPRAGAAGPRRAAAARGTRTGFRGGTASGGGGSWNAHRLPRRHRVRRRRLVARHRRLRRKGLGWRRLLARHQLLRHHRLRRV